jgi:hypothetical protein
MKGINHSILQILVVFATVICPLATLSQNTLFPDSNAVWSVWEEKFYLNGDSVFGGKTYNKVYMTTDSVVTPGVNSTLAGLMRSDSASQKVWGIHPDSTREHLMYDFTAEVGDDLEIYSLDGNRYQLEVIDKDSMLIHGVYHNTLELKGPIYEGELWIEGIGSNAGLIYGGAVGNQFFDVLHFPQLLCFERDGNRIYESDIYDEVGCYASKYWNSVDELSGSKSQVEVYPNPTFSKVFIESSERFKSYKIYSMTGKLVQSGALKQNSIDVAQLTKGSYFLKLSDGSDRKAVSQLVVN